MPGTSQAVGGTSSIWLSQSLSTPSQTSVCGEALQGWSMEAGCPGRQPLGVATEHPAGQACTQAQLGEGEMAAGSAAMRSSCCPSQSLSQTSQISAEGTNCEQPGREKGTEEPVTLSMMPSQLSSTALQVSGMGQQTGSPKPSSVCPLQLSSAPLHCSPALGQRPKVGLADWALVTQGILVTSGVPLATEVAYWLRQVARAAVQQSVRVLQKWV